MAHPMNANLFNRAAQALRREARKAAMLTFLVAVLGILWARMAMKNGDLPAQANAAMTLNKAAIGLDRAGRGSDTSKQFHAWLNAPLAPINRNLFAVNLDYFPQDSKPAAEQNQAGGGFWGELAKSVSARADVSKERQILLENLQQQASQLKLQTTVMGTRPKAVVNGELVGEGDVVASGSGDTRTRFRVLKIESRRIILEREGIKLEVPMK
jgi:hypothetical protein